MRRTTDLLLTALAPALWGSTYFVTTEWLPEGHPITLAMLRALPAGLLLLAIVKELPLRERLMQVLVLGTLNFAVFWTLLFVAAQRLPGGVAATLGSAQALLVLLLARGLLGTPVRAASVVAAMTGALGVALLVLGPAAMLDPLGLAAGVGGAVAMAAGTVLSRKWQAGIAPLTYTGWQLTVGGLVLLPIALLSEPPLPALQASHLGGLVYLGLMGAALTYFLWFRGLARLGPATVSLLALLSPVTAVSIGWLALDQSLTTVQCLGVLVVLLSVSWGQRVAARPEMPKAGYPRFQCNK
ncbi:EamA family transporter [Rhodoferax sp.]|uniref:EamA family transporter n=1 Tax=Rhodoferax sp. TaxID=50421 RepID=UPI002730F957|nr:EamA family transporter [Rhodoferax sp.]MDP1531213.1 EamA family transporter [Rhodoferax sp.]MDP1942263.1 EamA family transporter [Rhodoferax sp.]MDP2441283.1 EamA family transporter [Rhodoferax sp.]MDZ4207940.1 EamA family transporter [Rhodoferax sp.]